MRLGNSVPSGGEFVTIGLSVCQFLSLSVFLLGLSADLFLNPGG